MDIFKNKNVLYLIMVIIMLAVLFWFGGVMDDNVDEWEDKFSKMTTDMHACPKTAQYFSNFQSNFNTATLPTITCMFIGLISLVFFYITCTLAPGITLEQMTVPLIFYMILVGFLSTYKISNCMLVKMCPDSRACIEPLFASPSPA